MSEFVSGHTPTLLRSLRWAYAVWAVVFAAIVLQFYLAGRAVFGLLFGGPADFDTHITLGYLLPLVALVGIGLAFLAQAAWRVTGINTALVLLVFLQPMFVYTKSSPVAAIHVVNAGLIFAGVAYLVLTAFRVARTTKAAETVPDANGDASKTPAVGTESGHASE